MATQFREGQRLQGSDGNIYVVRGGVPVLADDYSAPQPMTLGRPSAKAAYEAPKAAADLAKTQQDMELARAKAQREAIEWAATHNPDGTPKTQLTKQQVGLARSKLGNLTAIENQIRRVEQALDAAEKKGFTGPFWGRLPGTGAFDPESAVLDKSIAQLAPLIRQLTRVPGEGAMSDYEARLAQMSLPSRADNPAAVREAISGLRDLIGQTSAGYREMLGEQGGMDKSSGLTTDQPGGDQRELATGATRTIHDPERAKLIEQLIVGGQNAEQINKALGTNISQAEIDAVVRYRKQHPSYSGFVNATKEVPTTLWNRVPSSPLGVGLTNYFDAATAGAVSNIVGQEGRENIRAANQANPGPALVGSGLGSLSAAVGAGKLLAPFKIGQFAAANPRAAALLGDTLYGGVTGYNQADDDQGGTGAVLGAAGGLIGNRIGAGATKVLGGVARGVVDPGVQYLRSRGIPLTIGQIGKQSGGPIGRAIGGLEESLANTNGVNALVNPRRMEGLRAYNLAEFQDAGAPINYAPTSTGAGGVAQLDAAKSAAYRAALDPTNIDVNDAALIADLRAAHHRALSIPDVEGASSATQAALASRIGTPADKGHLTGREFQEAYRGLGRTARERAGKDYGYETGQVMRQAQDALASALERQNPGAYDGFLRANAANRNLNVIADAVSRARNADDQLFSPAQMATARDMSDKMLQGKVAAATSRLRRSPLTEYAQAVLPNKTPPTGVNAAPVMALGGAALYGSGEATDNDWMKTATLLSLPALPYTRTGQALLAKSLLDRPAQLVRVGDYIINKAAYPAGLIGRGAGVGLAGLLGN